MKLMGEVMKIKLITICIEDYKEIDLSKKGNILTINNVSIDIKNTNYIRIKPGKEISKELHCQKIDSDMVCMSIKPISQPLRIMN